jgi:hypothetical protein
VRAVAELAVKLAAKFRLHSGQFREGLMKTSWYTRAIGVFIICVLTACSADAAHLKLAILESDFAVDAQSDLFATGKFQLIADFDVQAFTPTLAMISTYDAVLAYTNNPPDDPDAFGDLLADYVDAGGHVVLANYSFWSPPLFNIGGRIMTSGYSPLLFSGNFGPLGGVVVPTVPTDPIYTGITPANVTYSYTTNGPLPTLASGATLLATDGIGQNLIARNAAGNVLAATLYPATASWAPGNNAEFYRLLANLVDPLLSPTVPEPSSMPLVLAGLIAAALVRRAPIFLARC